jgi:DNA modification methylase
MAKQLNRDFIGIEKVEDYYEIAKARVGSCEALLNL